MTAFLRLLTGIPGWLKVAGGVLLAIAAEMVRVAFIKRAAKIEGKAAANAKVERKITEIKADVEKADTRGPHNVSDTVDRLRDGTF